MSKVIHLTTEAHSRAKGFCERHGLKMSHWVAELIDRAVAGDAADGKEGGELRPAWGARRRLPAEAAPGARAGEEGGPGLGAPPFWADTSAS